MRTSEQISSWLIGQEWYTSFCERLKAQASKEKVAMVLSGRYAHNTIDLAFDWSKTVEGLKYWWNADDAFKKWYGGEG